MVTKRTLTSERKEAKALSERELTPAEAVTVVLSKKGWVRSQRARH